MSDRNPTAQSNSPDPHKNPQPQLVPSNSPQPADNAPVGIVSKRRAQRAIDRLVSGKAVEIDTEMRGKIDEAAEGLGVAPETLAQKFAIVAPIGETRKPMWWNGLVAEKTEEWRDQYEGPGRGLLPYVTARMRDEKLKENTTPEERERLEKKARETRVLNKAQKAAAMTRAKALKAAQEKIEHIYAETFGRLKLQQLHGQLGIEFALFATRSSFGDDMDPLYLSSDKAKLFFQGHLNIPPKELLKLMDMSVITGVGGMSAAVANQKETHRQGVRTKLNASYCAVLKSLGHDVSNFRHISYKNYDELVRKYHIVLRGYPLTPEGCIVGPSDFPGGIPGLAHAEKQLEAGKWGFEKIEESTYNDWVIECNEAKEDDQPMPLPPHILAPGTEFVKPLKRQKATGSDGPKPKSRKRGGNNDGSKESEQERVRPKPKPKAKRGEGSRGTFKSREVIEDSDSEQDFTGDRQSDDDEGSGSP